MALIRKTCGGQRDPVHSARRRIEGRSLQNAIISPPGLNLARQAANVPVGEQKYTMDTNKSDKERLGLPDLSGFGYGPRPSPASSASCEIGPRHLPLSCRSFSSGTHFELKSNGIAKIFTLFVNSYTSPQIDW